MARTKGVSAEKLENTKKRTRRTTPSHVGCVSERKITQDEQGVDVFDRDLSFMSHKIGHRRTHEAKLQVKKMVGRPGIYTPEAHPRLVYLLMAHGGFTQEQLATVLDVPYGTFLSWLHRYPAFADAVQCGRDFWNSESLERTLYQRATGYEVDEVEVSRVPIYEYEYDDKGKPCQVVTGYEHKETKRVTKNITPDTASLLFVLQNRRPDRWKNTRYVKVEAESTMNHQHAHLHLGQGDGGPAPVQELNTEQLQQLVSMAQEMGVLPDITTGKVLEIENVQEAEVVNTEGA